MSTALGCFFNLAKAMVTNHSAFFAVFPCSKFTQCCHRLTARDPLQVLAQLKKFARTVKSVREAVKPPPKTRRREQLSLGDGSGGFQRPNANMDLSEMLRTDITGMDATVTGL